MYEVSRYVTIYIYIFSMSYLKTIIHEGGHVLALTITDLWLRKFKKTYDEPYKYLVRSAHGDGRIESELYAVLADKHMYGWLRFNVAGGELAELVCLAPLFFVTYYLFHDLILSCCLIITVFFVSICSVIGSKKRPQSDISIFLSPQTYDGNFCVEKFHYGKIEKAGIAFSNGVSYILFVVAFEIIFRSAIFWLSYCG